MFRELLGHSNVKTTMIYTHVLNRGPSGVRRPIWKGFEKEVLMPIRITCRYKRLTQRQLVAGVGFIVPSREYREASYTGTSENSRILYGAI